MMMNLKEHVGKRRNLRSPDKPAVYKTKNQNHKRNLASYKEQMSKKYKRKKKQNVNM